MACTTNPLAATGGTATFAGCKITGKAGVYTLTAAASGLPTVTSASFTITAGTATQLLFSTQPGPARRCRRGHRMDDAAERDG